METRTGRGGPVLSFTGLPVPMGRGTAGDSGLATDSHRWSERGASGCGELAQTVRAPHLLLLFLQQGR